MGREQVERDSGLVSPTPVQPNLGQSTFIIYTEAHIVGFFEERISHFTKVKDYDLFRIS